MLRKSWAIFRIPPLASLTPDLSVIEKLEILSSSSRPHLGHLS